MGTYRNNRKLIEKKGLLVVVALVPIYLFLFGSCVMTPDEYDSSGDNGTYTGTMIVYDGEGTNPDFIDRTCPEVAASLVVQGDSVVLTTTDTYPNYGHSPGVVTTHVASGTSYANNKFKLTTSWAIEETDVQLEDLMNLKICDSTPPSTPGDTSTGNRGFLQDFALKVDEPGFVGEYGNGKARGSLLYGVRCSDGRYLPICFYFMQLQK